MKKHLLFIFAMAALLCFLPYVNGQDIETGLVVYYPMDGDGISGIDGGPEATLGNIEEGVPTDIIGVLGFNGDENGALQFDGEGDKVYVSDLDLVGLPVGAADRTFACWVLVNPDNGNLVFINYGTPGEDPRGGHVHLTYRPQEGGEGRVRVGHWYADYDFDEIALGDSLWHHVAYTFNGDEFNLYLDGQHYDFLDVDPDLAEVNTTLNGEFAIGARNVPEYNDVLAGAMDEVRVYDRVLTEDDITALYAYDPSAVIDAVANANETSFNISPNPAIDFINIKGISSGDHISLINILGQEVMSGIALSNEHSFDTSSLRAGAYLVRVNNTTQKILVK